MSFNHKLLPKEVPIGDNIVVNNIEVNLALVFPVPSEILVVGHEHDFTPSVDDDDGEVGDESLVILVQIEIVVQAVGIAGRDGVRQVDEEIARLDGDADGGLAVSIRGRYNVGAGHGHRDG